MASNRLRVRQSLHDERISDAFSRFEQVERALDVAEGAGSTSTTWGRGAQAGVSLEAELAGLETDAAVDDELARLKRRLSGDANLPATRVEDDA